MSFNEFWQHMEQRRVDVLMNCSELEVLVEMKQGCQACRELLEFLLDNVERLDRIVDSEVLDKEAFKVYRRSKRYSLRCGEVFAMVRRPNSHESRPVEFHLKKQLLFSQSDLNVLEQKGNLPDNWESGPGTDPDPPDPPPPSACSYCSKMLLLHFIYLNTYPRPPEKFSLMVELEETFGSLAYFIYMACRESDPALRDVEFRVKNKPVFASASWQATLRELNMKPNMLITIHAITDVNAPIRLSVVESPSDPSVRREVPVTILCEFGLAPHRKSSVSPLSRLCPRRLPLLVDDYVMYLGMEIAIRCVARIVKNRVVKEWNNVQATKLNELKALDELMAEQEKKVSDQRKKDKKKEQKEDLKRAQVQMEKLKAEEMAKAKRFVGELSSREPTSPAPVESIPASVVAPLVSVATAPSTIESPQLSTPQVPQPPPPPPQQQVHKKKKGKKGIEISSLSVTTTPPPGEVTADVLPVQVSVQNPTSYIPPPSLPIIADPIFTALPTISLIDMAPVVTTARMSPQSNEDHNDLDEEEILIGPGPSIPSSSHAFVGKAPPPGFNVHVAATTATTNHNHLPGKTESTMSCPRCGKENYIAALECFSCRSQLQTQITTEYQQHITSPPIIGDGNSRLKFFSNLRRDG